MFQQDGYKTLPSLPLKRGRNEKEYTVQRNHICPSSVHVYRFLSEDIATQSEVCSAVLHVPSIGIATPTPSVKAAAAAVAFHPSVVLTMWSDTSAADVAMLLLENVRDEVDASFITRQVDIENHSLVKPDNSTQSTAVYIVKLLVGFVSAGGSATLRMLANVELRQVLEGEPFVFPVRRADTVDVEAPIVSLLYRLGDPLFFTCTRLQ